MTPRPPVLLASGSPRRRELLTAMGLDFEVRVSGVDEDAIPADHPRTFALRAAYLKAEAVARDAEPGTLVIAADTVVTKDLMLYGKPADHNEARRILTSLAGRAHQVITGVAVARAGSPGIRVDSETTEVVFREATAADIDAYIRTGTVLDKAGAYGIQEQGENGLVERIEGDYFNVVGLPCRLLATLLEEHGVTGLSIPPTPARWTNRPARSRARLHLRED